MFGAKGDGITDDAAAFQSAIASNTTLTLDANKRYRIGSYIKIEEVSGVKIIGNGAVVFFEPKDRVTAGFYINKASNFLVQDVRFESERTKIGQAPNGHARLDYNDSNILGIYIIASSHGKINGCSFTNMNMDIMIQSDGKNFNNDITIQNWISENASMPSYCAHGRNIVYDGGVIKPASKLGAGNHAIYVSNLSDNVKIYGFKIVSPDGCFGPLITGHCADASLKPNNIKVSNCQLEGGRMIFSQAESFIIENCVFKQTQETSFDDDSTFKKVGMAINGTANYHIKNCRFELECPLFIQTNHIDQFTIEDSYISINNAQAYAVSCTGDIRLKNCEIKSGNLYYAGGISNNTPTRMIVEDCKIEVSNYVLSRRKSSLGEFCFINNSISTPSYFVYNAGSSDCSGLYLYNNKIKGVGIARDMDSGHGFYSTNILNDQAFGNNSLSKRKAKGLFKQFKKGKNLISQYE